jgi:CRP/FNR family nitrogen fixation transcriptional regulator
VPEPTATFSEGTATARPDGAPCSPSLPALLGERLAFGPGDTVFAEQEPAGRLYAVIDGLVRTLRVDRGGRRIVYGFYAPGEVFGLESGPAHRCAAEAVGETQVARYERARLETRAMADRAMATRLWRWLTLSGEQANARLALLAHGSAEQKLAHFLLDLDGRIGAAGGLELAMTRYDIADYLGLSSETVSRTITALRHGHLIAAEGRQVRLLNRAALHALAALN